MVITSTLTRTTTVTSPDDWDKRLSMLLPRLRPLLEQQTGFVSHEIRRDGDRGRMVEVTAWRTADDCRAYLRNGGAAMAATLLDAHFPTATCPNAYGLRETSEAGG